MIGNRSKARFARGHPCARRETTVAAVFMFLVSACGTAAVTRGPAPGVKEEKPTFALMKKAEAKPSATLVERAGLSEGEVLTLEAEVDAKDAPGDASLRVSVFEGMEAIRLQPSWKAPVIGLIHAGQSVEAMVDAPIEGAGVEPCLGGWYAVAPRGFVCVGHRSTLLRNDPRTAAAAEALLGSPARALFRYGVSIGSPRYLRIPTREEQRREEPGLVEHLSRMPEANEEGAIDTHPAGMAPTAALRRYFSQPARTLVSDEGAFEGMKVAWTREFDAEGRTWLLTPDLALIPKDKVRVKSLPSLRGVDLREGGEAALPMAYLWLGEAPKLRKGPGGALVETGEVWPRQGFVPLSGRVVKQGRALYLEARDGSYVRQDRVTRIERARSRPKGVGPKDKWISVRATRGYLVAYEGDKPVYATAVSPGMNGVNPALEYTTKPGLYSVQVKALSWDMAGVERGKPWVVKDVPFVAFYKDNFGLHGAWWHDDFGRPKSHGCINLSPEDARALFAWMDPVLPEGWYSVSALGEKLKGTVIEVRP